jgi:fucose permease
VWSHLAIVGAIAVIVTVRISHLLPADAHVAEPAAPSAGGRRVVTLQLVLLGLLTACTTLGEGAAADWGAIFLHDERGTAESLAAIGFAAFAGAMAVGRLSGPWVLSHVSRVTALRASSVLASASVLTLVAVDSATVGLVAMIGWGLGVALVFPAAMSAGAENAERPAQGIATVATIGYGGFLVGPPLVGFVAGAAGLGTGLLVVSALLLVAVALAPAARPPRIASTAAPSGVRVGAA